MNAKPSAFNPWPGNELSTAHVTGMTAEAIWTLSRSALGVVPGREKIYAQASVKVATALENGLEVMRDNDPFSVTPSSSVGRRFQTK